MGDRRVNEYKPDSASSPGETLLDVLEERGMSQAELAERTGRPLKTINEIIKGKCALTADTSIQLERVLGIPAEFWNQREANYRAFLSRDRELKDLLLHVDWLKQFPMKDMIKREWLADPGKDKSTQIISLLNFFAVANPAQWTEGWTKHRLAFRKSAKLEAKLGPTSVWLRQGEIEANRVQCSVYNREKLLGIIPQLRTLTREPDPQVFIPQLQKICSEVGVAVVFVQPFKGVPISGASKWLNPSKAMIQLSLRGKTDDLLWFTLFHEINHILHHSKKEMFVDFDKKEVGRPQEEIEADQLAAEQLLPQHLFEAWIQNRINLTSADVKQFAQEQGIAPGIVVGRLQFKRRIEFSSPLNSLKIHYAWE